MVSTPAARIQYPSTAGMVHVVSNMALDIGDCVSLVSRRITVMSVPSQIETLTEQVRSTSTW